MLNGALWISQVEVPAEGVASAVTEADIKENLDPKIGQVGGGLVLTFVGSIANQQVSQKKLSEGEPCHIIPSIFSFPSRSGRSRLRRLLVLARMSVCFPPSKDLWPLASFKSSAATPQQNSDIHNANKVTSTPLRNISISLRDVSGRVKLMPVPFSWSPGSLPLTSISPPSTGAKGAG